MEHVGFSQQFLEEIRDKFMWVDTCPYTGRRIFLENAGGSLTLKSVVETSERYASLADNTGRPNAASRHMELEIVCGKDSIRDFFNVDDGEVFVGETGTELIFRLVGAVALEHRKSLKIAGSTLEHPSTRSASTFWAERLGGDSLQIPHDSAEGTVTAAQYGAVITPSTRVATVVHTSPVTGMTVDLAGISRVIRSVSPDCFIVVDGIQHAGHGPVDLSCYDIDAYVISPYKAFSRHGYGIAWISDRLAGLPHSRLAGASPTQWELGTRDVGAFATFSKVVAYLDWLGGKTTSASNRRKRLQIARQAIRMHENALITQLVEGSRDLPGVRSVDGVTIIGGVGTGHREGLVSFAVKEINSLEIVMQLEARGIRVHLRKNDHYSGNILGPMGLSSCVRVSVAHYNSPEEINAFLRALHDITSQ